MDNIGDPTIRFNEDGTCNYCSDALKTKDLVYFPNEKGKDILESQFEKVKKEGKGKPYDCMVGLSGGLDSSYASYIGHKYGLRILAVNVDDGMDAEVTRKNIKRICSTFNIELHTIKPDKERFADLTRAFILAGVPDIAIPQDNVLFASLYNFAQKNKINYFLSGANFSLESITQSGFDALDTVHILDIHKKYGRLPLDGNLPLFTVYEKRLKYKYFYNIKSLTPLYYLDYNAQNALKELNDACGYEYYGNKHWESIFTKFIQVYYLPKKFNIDKRKSHYSSLIISGQMTRDEALNKLKEPLYDEKEMQLELEFLLKELNIDKSEFERVMLEKPNKHENFKTSSLNKFAQVILRLRKKTLGY